VVHAGRQFGHSQLSFGCLREAHKREVIGQAHPLLALKVGVLGLGVAVDDPDEGADHGLLLSGKRLERGTSCIRFGRHSPTRYFLDEGIARAYTSFAKELTSPLS
jgi:hypothetical protein